MSMVEFCNVQVILLGQQVAVISRTVGADKFDSPRDIVVSVVQNNAAVGSALLHCS
jgi:hypothetical protein